MTNTFGELLGAEICERRESAGMTQRELAEESFSDPEKTDTFERRIRELESDAPPANPRAKTYQPLCDTLNIDRPMIRAMKAQASNSRAQAEAERTELSEDIGPIKDALSDTSGLSRNQLIVLAELFGVEAPEGASDATLRAVLTNKAEEYGALRSEVDGISEGLKRLSNLKTAAQDAIARVDLEEVEEILSRVQEVEKEEAARTAELRADNALLRGKVEQAAALLADAADSFRIIDPLEPARRRILGAYKGFPALYNHGLRYGGHGLTAAAEMVKAVLDDDLRRADTVLWAKGQNNLALALQQQGTRTEGLHGAALLAQAVTAYFDALEVCTRADHPIEWAMTQNNLGLALQNQGIRTDGPKGTSFIAQAVSAYRAALEVRTRTDHPEHWAMTQNNLGLALESQGIRTEGPKGATLLVQAVSAYREARSVYSREEHPVDWALVQNNLGNAIQEQGVRIEGPKGVDLLSQAVSAYREALEIRTRADHPVAWAMTQNNLGIPLRYQGTRTEGAQGGSFFSEAISAYRSALEVRTRKDHPVAWAETQGNIAIALLSRASHDSAKDPRTDLTEALFVATSALEVFDPIHLSYNRAQIAHLRNDIQTALDALP